MLIGAEMNYFRKHHDFKCIINPFTYFFSLLGLVFFGPSCIAQQARYPFQEITREVIAPEIEWNIRGHREFKSIAQSKSDFEIRFDVFAKWHNRMATVITRKDGKYVANFYHKQTESLPKHEQDSSIKYKGEWERYNFKKFPITQVNLDSLVEQLLTHQILSLPDQSKIYKKGFLSPFLVSYKVNGKVGSFRFGSPEDPIREHPDEPVYQHYDAILNMYGKITTPMYRQVWADVEEAYKKEQLDTIFLRKPHSEGHSVYVDKNKDDDDYHNMLTDLEDTIADQDYIKKFHQLKPFKDSVANQISIGKLPRHWIPLYNYKGNYYLYWPSNRVRRRLSIYGNTLVFNDMERSVSSLNKVSTKDNKTFEVRTTKVNGSQADFKIRFIPYPMGIAVFEDFFGKGSKMLMVDAKYAAFHLVIVNHTPKNMEPEFIFEDPDYEELLNPKRK